MAKETMVHVVKKFYPYFWHKFKFPVKNDTESECEELVKNLRDAVWVHRIVSFKHWHPFVEMNLIPMVSSLEMYASCIFFMISTTINSLNNRYETFMTTCSLVTAVAAYIYDKGYHEFLDYSPTILMVFFEEFHDDVFQKFKIWDHLQEYLINNNYSDAYGIVEDRTKGNPFADVIFQVDFVREISLKIKSKIPFSEGAAVYNRTREVLKYFETEEMSGLGMSKLVYGERFLHKVMKGVPDDYAKEPRHEDVKKPEAESAKDLTISINTQSTTKPETINLNITSLSDLVKELRNLNLQADLGTGEKVSEKYEEDVDMKMCPSKSDNHKDVRKGIIGKEDSTMMIKKVIRDDCAKEQRPKGVKKPEAENVKDLTISMSTQSTTKPKTIHLHIIPLSDLVKELRNLNLQSDLGTEKISETSKEDVDIKECPSKPDKHQDVRKQTMGKEDAAMTAKKEIRDDCAKEPHLEDVKIPQAATEKDSASSISKRNTTKPETILSNIMADCTKEKWGEDVKNSQSESAKHSALSTSTQSTSKPETVQSHIISLCDLMREMKNMNLHSNQGKDNISATYEEDIDSKTFPPKSDKLQDIQNPNMEKGDAAIGEKDAAFPSLERKATFRLEKLLPRWEKESRTTKMEEKVSNSEEVHKKQVQFSGEKFREACKEWLRMEDYKESASDFEEYGDFQMKKAQCNEKFRQACREWLQIEDSKKNASAKEKTGDTNLKRTPLYQSKNELLQTDVAKLRIKESEIKTCALEQIEEKNMKRVTTCQSKEQFPQKKKVKLEMKNDDESAFAVDGAEKVDLEPISANQKEKLLPKTEIDVSKGDRKESASSTQEMENINVKQISANQSEEHLLPADDIMKIKDTKERAFKVEETVEAMLKKTLTEQSGEKLHQANMDVLGIRDSKDNVSEKTETLKIDSKPVSTDHLEEQLRQFDIDGLKIKGKEESASLLKESEEIESDQAASHQEKIFRDKCEDSEQSITSKEEHNFKRNLTDESEEQMSKDFKLIAMDSKGYYAAAKKLETFLRQASTNQREEQMIQNGLEQAEINDSEESASTIECEDMGLNASMDQSIEHCTLDDVDESKITDDERRAPVESNIGDDLSDDDCQFEAENLMEDEYLDAGLVETKDASANTSTPKKQRRRRKRKSKPKQQKPDSDPDPVVPSTEVVAQTLVTIFTNSRNSLRDIFEVLEISRDN